MARPASRLVQGLGLQVTAGTAGNCTNRNLADLRRQFQLRWQRTQKAEPNRLGRCRWVPAKAYLTTSNTGT